MKQFLFLLLATIGCLLSCRKDKEPRFSLGQTYGGGIIFYIDQSGEHGWIAAKEDLPMAVWGISTPIVQGIDYYPPTNAISTTDGFANTTKIVAVYGDTIYAAKSCYDYTGGDFKDWYLPAKDQLDSLYRRSISNIASLTMRHDYMYWSSTEVNNFDAWWLDFGYGYWHSARDNYGIYWPDKVIKGFIRPVRSF